jgi:hypothetical protein
VSLVEWGAVTLFALLGLRSLVHWLRRPLISDVARDRVLFALFVVSRAGLWFALAGLFLLYATIHARGRPFADAASDLRWYFFVLVVPAVGQFITGFLLGQGRPGREPQPDPDGDRAS